MANVIKVSITAHEYVKRYPELSGYHLEPVHSGTEIALVVPDWHIIEQIEARTVNDTTRSLMCTGFIVSHDDVSDEDIAWVRNRLGLTVSVNEDGLLMAMPAETR